MHLHNARTHSKKGGGREQVGAQKSRLTALAEINMGDALGPRQKEKGNKLHKQEETEYAASCYVCRVFGFFYLLIFRFLCAYLALYHKINNYFVV
jgi:hypothetical protein